MARVYSDNPLWVLCCCGCLPFVGLIKWALIAPFIFPIWAIAVPGIALICLPWDIVMTFYTFVMTKSLGFNAKCLAILLLPIPLAIWPPLVFASTCFTGLMFPLYKMMASTFDDNDSLCFGGIGETFSESFDMIKSFWEFNTHSYFDYLFHLRTEPCDNPFELKIFQIIIGLVIGILGCVIDGIFGTIIVVVKSPGALFQAYKYLWEGYFDVDGCLMKIILLPLFLIGNGLAASSLPLFILGGTMVSIYLGVHCAVTAHNKGSISAGLVEIINNIGMIDDGTSDFTKMCKIFGGECDLKPEVCLCCFASCCEKRSSANRDLERQNEKKNANQENPKGEENNDNETDEYITAFKGHMQNRKNEFETQIISAGKDGLPTDDVNKLCIQLTLADIAWENFEKDPKSKIICIPVNGPEFTEDEASDEGKQFIQGLNQIRELIGKNEVQRVFAGKEEKTVFSLQSAIISGQADTASNEIKEMLTQLLLLQEQIVGNMN
jgi:hypothetical protein